MHPSAPPAGSHPGVLKRALSSPSLDPASVYSPEDTHKADGGDAERFPRTVSSGSIPCPRCSVAVRQARREPPGNLLTWGRRGAAGLWPCLRPVTGSVHPGPGTGCPSRGTGSVSDTTPHPRGQRQPHLPPSPERRPAPQLPLWFPLPQAVSCGDGSKTAVKQLLTPGSHTDPPSTQRAPWLSAHRPPLGDWHSGPHQKTLPT